MEILSDKYLADYKKRFGKKIENGLRSLDINSSDNNFEYYLQSSAVYSSNIEGNTIDLNSFMNSKLLGKKIRGKEFNEIEDLTIAYKFAKQNSLNEKQFLKTHNILSKQFLIKSKQGKYRVEQIGVFDVSGPVYMAVEPDFVSKLCSQLFEDIKKLETSSLSVNEIFYFAAFIHLVTAHIHPFMDGNGRAARLLEKWFISKHLGEIAWKIRSEKFYFDKRSEYYENINLGHNYYELDYEDCVPFLSMLPHSITKI